MLRITHLTKGHHASTVLTVLHQLYIHPPLIHVVPRGLKLKRSFCFSLRICVDARMHTKTGDEDLW